MKVRVSGLVWMPKAGLGDGLAHLKKLLTIVPRKTVYDDEPPTPVPCWAETLSEFGIPREYFFSTAKQSHEVTWDLAEGQIMSCWSALRQKGDYAEQAQALDELEGWLRGFDDAESPLQAGQHLGCILQADPGFGKTATALELARRLGRTTLIVVHKEFLLTQWVRRIETFMPDAKIGIVREDTCDFEGKDFVIAMVQSLALEGSDGQRYPEALYRYFGLIVIDEVHRIGAASWSRVPKLFSAKWRVGLTATPRRKDGADKVFWWHIGQIRYAAKTKRPVLSVRMVVSDIYGPDVLRKEVSPSIIVSILSKLTGRNRAIVREIMSALKSPSGRKLMVLSERLEHLRTLDEMLKKEAALAGIAVTTGFYVGEWFTGETSERIVPGHWDMKNGGRKRAEQAIFASLSRRQDPLAKKADDGERCVLIDLGRSPFFGHRKLVYMPIEQLTDEDLFDLARTHDIKQKAVEKRRHRTEVELAEAERAQVIWATYQMTCVDAEAEFVDPMTGESWTIARAVDVGQMPLVVSGRGDFGVSAPVAVGLSGIKPCVKITTLSGRSRVVSEDHGMWTVRGWVRADELIPSSGARTECDHLASPRMIEIEPRSTKLTKSDAWLLGLLVGDGSLSCPERGTFELTTGDECLVSAANDALLARGMFLKKSRHQHWITRCIQPYAKGVRHKKSWLRGQVERLGMDVTARHKRVPQEIMWAPTEVAESFLAGYFDADGCIDARGCVSFSSVSAALLEQTRTLLLRLGIPVLGELIQSGDTRVLCLPRSGSELFRARIPSRLPRRRDRVGANDSRMVSVGHTNSVPYPFVAELKRVARGRGILVEEMVRWCAEAGVSASSMRFLRGDLPLEGYLLIAGRVGFVGRYDSRVVWDRVTAVERVGVRMTGDLSVPPDKSWLFGASVVHNSEGIDIPAVDTIGFATPISDVEQSYGRGRRVCVPVAYGGDKTPETCERMCAWRAARCTGKPVGMAFDIVDLRVPMAMRRSEYRREFYGAVGAPTVDIDTRK